MLTVGRLLGSRRRLDPDQGVFVQERVGRVHPEGHPPADAAGAVHDRSERGVRDAQPFGGRRDTTVLLDVFIEVLTWGHVQLSVTDCRQLYDANGRTARGTATL